jgi:hypothetical protein
MKRLCVYCGSSPGSLPAYLEAARHLGALMARNQQDLVYGGGNVGMMGELAQSVLDHGGHVIGVIPRDLVQREVAHTGLSDLRVVDSMHERKALMAELADGFIALPGGIGTLEELLEVLTWAQLGLHRKPCGLLNVSGYFEQLMAFLDHLVDQRFLHPAHRAMLLATERAEDLLTAFEAYQPPIVDKAAWALAKGQP